jgi:acetylornithine deacetylase/succinyl-diaminopimelate desuccinylase-like protein
MASDLPSDLRHRHPREFPPSNGASASHVAGRPPRHGRATGSPLVDRMARPALLYARVHAERFVRELDPFLRFPSVSNSPKHRESVQECAQWLTRHLEQIGLADVRLIPTEGHPIVYAESEQRDGCPCLLVYGHYDVQPADPLAQWRSPPFTPTRRGDHLYARGASDDKGQLFIHVKAMESFLRARGSLPLHVKCVFEGEEETGSRHFAEFLRQNKSLLHADLGLISDTRILSPRQPVLVYGQRGMLSLELVVRGAPQDLHSGAFGGAIHNPVQALCEILDAMHDGEGRINIPGFYDRVRESTSRERAYFSAHAPSDEQILKDTGARSGWGEPGFSLFERTTIRPALTLNGIRGGYQGPGAKGIIPATATAKISFRLVPGQDPSEIESLLRRFLKEISPGTVQTSLRVLSGTRPVLMPPSHPANRVAAWAYRKAFGKSPVFLRSGGTIPVVNSLQDILGIPTVLMGFALPDDRMHAPNEKMYLPNFRRGIAASIWFMAALSQMGRGKTLT